ncbi:MAG: tRNA (adenosine(37)-N6)-threonylcarbamoyltransferase complex dimerization subunit type 1 TsaB [Hespellia sp.]|nr:tRNA (adenosine(37)-N6)-threonylcarbamoyltransferase complex dimerization subunit type 1 TsaB [Hespellia sp.]
MRILAVESSGLVASVAVVEEEATLAEYTVNYKKTHSQTLLPMLDEVVKMIELDLDTIDAIAVSGGPGSFTGLRIGSATAKGLGLALDKPLIHIPTLDGLAYNMYGCRDIICPIMDARRKQVYTGLYAFEAESLRTLEKQMAIPVAELVERLNGWRRPVVFLGDGVPVYRECLDAGLTVAHTYAPAHMNRQRGASVGALGIRYFKQGKTETAMEHQPDYLRVSQAERERAERERAAREDAEQEAQA